MELIGLFPILLIAFLCCDEVSMLTLTEKVYTSTKSRSRQHAMRLFYLSHRGLLHHVWRTFGVFVLSGLNETVATNIVQDLRQT